LVLVVPPLPAEEPPPVPEPLLPPELVPAVGIAWESSLLLQPWTTPMASSIAAVAASPTRFNFE
jgi:hypothetical protein